MVLDHGILGSLCPPVCICSPERNRGISAGRSVKRVGLTDTVIGINKPLQIGILLGVEQILRPFSRVLRAHVPVVIYFDSSCGTFLGGNHDNPVGSPGPIDRSCTGILQYGHGLNILRIDRVDIRGGNSVNNIQRAVILERTESPDPYFP